MDNNKNNLTVIKEVNRSKRLIQLIKYVQFHSQHC